METPVKYLEKLVNQPKILLSNEKFIIGKLNYFSGNN